MSAFCTITNKQKYTTNGIVARVGTLADTVNRVIAQDLGLQKRKKARGHKLSPRHIAERKTVARKFYEHYLARDKWKFVATLDEAWIYLSDCNKIRAIYYRPRGTKGHATWVRECKESFSRGFMVVAGFCYNGKFNLRRVAKNVKINSAYYQTEVLDPLFKTEVPALYGNDSSKVWVHKDKASSHTSRSTAAHMRALDAETGIHAIPLADIPATSPDAAPMDCCAFGLLKRALGKRRPRTIYGLWCLEDWDKISLVTLQRALLSWKLRCRAIVQARGRHIVHDRRWRQCIPPLQNRFH